MWPTLQPPASVLQPPVSFCFSCPCTGTADDQMRGRSVSLVDQAHRVSCSLPQPLPSAFYICRLDSHRDSDKALLHEPEELPARALEKPEGTGFPKT